MRTVQMTLDEDLIEEVDKASKMLQINRSAFTRKALAEAVDRYKKEQLEAKHRQGYKQHPATVEEFSVWENEQEWGDK